MQISDLCFTSINHVFSVHSEKLWYKASNVKFVQFLGHKAWEKVPSSATELMHDLLIFLYCMRYLNIKMLAGLNNRC